MLRHPCILGDTQCQARRVESEVVLNKGEQNQKWLPHPAFSGAQKRVEMLRHPYILGDPQRQRRGVKSEQIPNKGEQNQKWLPNTCPLGDPKEGGSATSPMHSGRPKRGRKCYVTPAFSGILNAKRGEQNQKWSSTKANKIRSGYLTPPFSGTQKRGTKSGVATSPLPSRGPGRGRKCYVTPAILGDPQQRGAKSEVVPNKGEQNQKWPPYLLGGPKEGGNAMSPLRSRGSPTKGSKRALTRPMKKSPSRGS